MITILPGRRIRIPGEATNRRGLAFVALALLAFFALRSDRFLTTSNMLNTGMAMSTIAILAIGSAALLVSGNVDLSIGSSYALVAVSVGQVVHHTENTALAVLFGLLLGALLGLINGALVWQLQLSPLIVTIGTLAIFRGLAFVVSDGVPVYDFPDSFVELGRVKPLGVPSSVWVAVAVFVIGAIILVGTRAGLRTYAIGGNDLAAMRKGVRVRRMVIGLYVVNGLLVGLAGVLITARLGSVSPNLGSGLEFDVLTAVILGGIAFNGGSGAPLGVAIGVVTIGILNTGLLFEGLEDYWQQIAKGSLLVAALASDQILKGRRRPRRKSGAGATDDATAGDDPPPSIADIEIEAHDWDRHAVPVLEASGVGRSFGNTVALRGVDLAVRPGEVVCLVGDNGAGKSTLIQILAGAIQSDTGEIRIGGEPVEIESPRTSLDLGIQTVYQDLALVPTLSVAHNYVLGEEPTRRVLGATLRDDARAEEQARAGLDSLNAKLPDLRAPVYRLSGGQRQAVAIARAVHDGTRLMILDEPTAALGVAQTAEVLRLIRRVAARGTGVILISHDVETVLSIADTVVVLRLGEVVHQGPAADVTQIDLLQLMAGIVPDAEAAAPAAAPAEPAPLTPVDGGQGAERPTATLDGR